MFDSKCKELSEESITTPATFTTLATSPTTSANFDRGNKIIIFGLDNSSSTYVDNRKILVLGQGIMQRLDNTTY